MEWLDNLLDIPSDSLNSPNSVRFAALNTPYFLYNPLQPASTASTASTALPPHSSRLTILRIELMCSHRSEKRYYTRIKVLL